MSLLSANARELYRRAESGDARPLRMASQIDLSGFPVYAHNCHDNVARWIAVKAPGHRHVRGWLVAQTCGGYVFDKHSVVGIGAELLDITPRSDRFVLPFLPHEGTSEEFERLPPQETAPHGM